MSERVYQFYKDKWVSTKPIRGRTEDIRPIGKRRRDWETVTRKDLGNGEYSYCAKLWNTECVEYLPDGSIKLRIDGWATPSTAEFIYEHSPFRCFKRNRKLWVYVREDADETKTYPLGEGDLHLLPVDGGRWYRPAEPVKIKKQVVNRAKAKEARADVMAFLNWAKVMLKISDGWVMHETRKELFGWEGDKYSVGQHASHKDLLGYVTSGDEEKWLRALCHASANMNNTEQRTAEVVVIEHDWQGHKHTYNQSFYDIQINFDALKRFIYKVADSHADIHDIVEVEATNKTMTNVV